MSSPLNLYKPDRKIHLGVILLNSETEILDVAPIDMMHGLSKKFLDTFPPGMLPAATAAQALDLEFHWVSETNDPIRLTSGIKMLPTDTFETCPTLDIVLMGAHSFGYNPTPAELGFIRKSHAASTAFLTICGGFMAPLQAGIFDGKTATAPRELLSGLRVSNPGTEWLEKRWVRDGNLWTSGALLNGEDMVTAFVLEHWGREEGSLARWLADMGAWPSRDIDYKDVGGPVAIGQM